MPEYMKKYILMHKNIPVAEIGLDKATGMISYTGTVFRKEHMPVGIPVKKGIIDRKMLNGWWRGRSIPLSRDGIQNALSALQITDTSFLMEKSLGLSLSDQYWLCPSELPLKWADINFFQNSFSDDMGNILFGKKKSGSGLNLISPDNTSDGWLKKKWKIINGKRCLIKGGSGASWQEPYNEVFASRLMERLGIPHVSYELLYEEGYPYSVCEDFVTSDTELITAWYIMQTEKKPNHISIYRHYLNCCEKLGIQNIQESVNQMIVADYLIANEDRHQNNFGALRSAQNLKWLGAAPIYDCGTSLWFDKPVPLINASTQINCKPFKNSHEEQLLLVSDFDWLNLSALSGAEEEFREIVRDSLFVDEARRDALCRALTQRIKALRRAAADHKKSTFVDSLQSDLDKNIAYSGKNTSAVSSSLPKTEG